jgi:regulator of RNase E activity RraB
MTDLQRRRLFAMSGELGFDRQERIDIASVILGYEVTSWSRLSDEEADRLIDCFDGYDKITYILMSRVEGHHF